MARKASPTIIGSFALGAIAIGIVGLIAFGSGRFFVQHTRAVAFFAGDIQGLTVGAPVDVRGVQIGTVTKISIRLDAATMAPVIPVYMEFDSNRFDVQAVDRTTEEQRLRTAIQNGLHARLAVQSLVTGQLIVELDLDPDAPRTFIGADPATLEIPTSPSEIERIKNAIERLPLEQIANSAIRLFDDADRLVTAPEFPMLLHSLTVSSNDFDHLLNSAQADIDPLIHNVDVTLDSARGFLVEARGAAQQARITFGTGEHLMSTDLHDTARTAINALQRADKTFADADSLLAANSPQRYDLNQILMNLSAAARALRVFSDNLERRPNSLIMGK
jgi:paraquat-inducible protein B